MKKSYKEIQNFKVINLIFISLMLIITVLFVFEMGSTGKTLDLNAYVFFELICLAVLLLFYKMVIRIKRKTIIISFGVGLIKKKILIQEIKKETIIKKRISGFNGLGIRNTPDGLLFNTSSGEAIVFSTKFNQKIAIVSKHIEELIKIIQNNISEIEKLSN